MAPRRHTAKVILLALVSLLPTDLAAAAPLPADQYLVDSAADTGFGEALAGLGDVNHDGFDDFAICVPRAKQSSGGEGEVRVYFGNPAGISTNPSQMLHSPGNPSRFAYRIAGGDLDGDGFGDAAVVALPWSGTNTFDVVLWVFRGSPSGLQPPEEPAFQAPKTSGVAGFAVVGDVNGDKLPDLALGLPYVGDDEGEVLMFHGGPSLSWSKPDETLRPDQPRTSFGFFGRGQSDFNGDGFDDLLVGAPHYHQWAEHNGRAQLFLGSKNGLLTNAAWTATFPHLRARSQIDNNHHQYFGNYLAVDDFNQDGFSDAVITAPFAGQNDLGEGIIFCYYGTRRGLPSNFDWTIQANKEGSSLGLMAERIGDVNGDSYPDLLLSAPDFGNHQVREGLVAVFFGSPHGFSKEPNWTLESQNNHSALGMYGAGVGDLNGDGINDFVVSQNGSSVLEGFNPVSIGAFRILYGSRQGPRGSTGVMFGKPMTRWISEEWGRLGRKEKALAGVLVFCAGAVLVRTTRRVWRNQTVVVVEKDKRRLREEERERMSRDLHDELGSRITRLHLIAESVQRVGADPDSIRVLSDTVTKEAKSLRAAVEDLAFRLSPEALTADGLVRAINRHAQTFFSGTSIRCFNDLPLEVPGTPFDGRLQCELFPCVKEALANVLRHSKATEVWLKVRLESEVLRVSVTDNGVGFVPSPKQRGRGLQNFSARMSRVGGNAEVLSSPGEGTSVTFTLPIAADSGSEVRPIQMGPAGTLMPIPPP